MANTYREREQIIDSLAIQVITPLFTETLEDVLDELTTSSCPLLSSSSSSLSSDENDEILAALDAVNSILVGIMWK